MFIGAHEAEYMFVTTLLKIEQHLLAQGRCPYSHLAMIHPAGELVAKSVWQALRISYTLVLFFVVMPSPQEPGDYGKNEKGNQSA